MALTDSAVRTAKPTPHKTKPGENGVNKLSDGNGLQLCVMPTGGKLWRLAYRFGGKERTLSIGGYPAVGIADARRVAEAARSTLARGIDPNAQKKSDKLVKAASDGNTFAAVAADMVAKKVREGKAARTISKIEWLLKLAAPFIGDLPIAGITALQVKAALQSVESTGKLETASRLRSVVGEVFRFAINDGKAANDPTSTMRNVLAAPKVTHRAAILEPKAFGALLRAIDGYGGQAVTRACLQLQALTFVRPGELRGALWAEFDLDGALWTIPASRTKMRKEHRVPLPPQAVAILAQLQSITGRGALLFPGLRAYNRPLSDGALGAALRTMGFAQDVHSPHGFRSTASTLLNECGKFSVSGIEAALGHQDPDRVRAAYARGSYWAERVEIARYWADSLDQMKAAV